MARIKLDGKVLEVEHVPLEKLDIQIGARKRYSYTEKTIAGKVKYDILVYDDLTARVVILDNPSKDYKMNEVQLMSDIKS